MTPPTEDLRPGSASRDAGDEASSNSPDAARGEAGEPAPAAGEEPRPDGKRGVCELCGGTTVERHCKIVCLNCGYKRDCSDP